VTTFEVHHCRHQESPFVQQLTCENWTKRPLSDRDFIYFGGSVKVLINQDVAIIYEESIFVR